MENLENIEIQTTMNEDTMINICAEDTIIENMEVAD